MPAKDRLIVALDVDRQERVQELVTSLQDQVGMFKIGLQPFCLYGPGFVSWVKGQRGRVFLDLKFHDIPRTAAEAARAAVGLGVDMFNVHVAGGRQMMQAVVQAVREEAGSAPPPLVLGVTLLTSLGPEQMHKDLGISGTPTEQVVFWAKMARECGLDGVVASPQEIEAVRSGCGDDFLIVTPGIRPAGAAGDDQKRISTPSQALRSGADYLVVGRPIVQAADPVQAAAAIISEMEAES